MRATYESLTKFVQKHGAVTVLDSQHRARELPSGEADIHDVVEKADRFVFQGKWYSRGDFEALLDRL